MNGIYEHRRWFRRHYEPAFEVSNEGVLYHQHLYVWGDIEDIQQRSSSGFAGFGFIIFTNGDKCVVNLHTFHKKGEELRLSFWGDNQAFDQLRKHIFRKKMESFKDPREGELLQQLDKLADELAVADEEKDISRIEKEIMRVTREQLRLSNIYTDKLKRYGEKGRSYHMPDLALIVCILAAIILLSWWIF